LYYQIRRITLRFKVKLIQKHKSSGNVLDIGCGTGEFLKEIRNKNFIVTGVEPNAIARDFARNQNKLLVIDEHEINTISSKKFDIITLWHVLEHVSDLNLRISQVNSLLREDGILIIAVPNSDSWDAREYEKFWAAYDLPRHLYHFNQKSMQNLLLKGGFSLVQIIPLIFDSFYISLLSEKYKTGKSNFFKAILNGFISNLWAMTHNKNYSSLIYIYKLNKNVNQGLKY
jgi:2-polyprenyl-3-methyl-5-hydroxy-6-metoxy-1,4-benzoquinol methylase